MIENQQIQSRLKTISPAGFWIRVWASLIDTGFSGILLLPLSLLTQVLQLKVGIILGSIIGMIIQYLPLGFLWVFFYRRFGATPGKLAFNLKVISSTRGQYMTAGQILGREFIGKLISLFLLLIGFLMIGFRKDKKSLHDIMFETSVIRIKDEN